MKFENNIKNENGEYINSSKLYLALDVGNKLKFKFNVRRNRAKWRRIYRIYCSKRIKLDKKYFALDSTKMEYEGNFAEEIPIFNFFKIPVEQNKGVWSIKALS